MSSTRTRAESEAVKKTVRPSGVKAEANALVAFTTSGEKRTAGAPGAGPA
jgi:hypothetical protein